MKKLINYTGLKRYGKKILFNKTLSPESVLFVLFMFFQIVINTNKFYLLIVAIYAIGLYLISENLMKTAWYGFISIFLFKQGKYFINVLTIPSSGTHLYLPVLYNVMFSDLFLIAVLYLMIRQKKLRKRPVEIYDFVLPVIVLIGIISSFLSYFPNISFYYLLQIIKYFIIYLTAKIILKTENIKKTTFEIFVLFTLFNGIFILLQKIHGGPFNLPIEHLNTWSQFGRFSVEQTDIYRPGGTMDDPNLISSIISMVLPVTLFLSLTKTGKFKKYLLISLTVLVLSILFSASRAVWLVTAMSSATAYYLYKSKIKLSYFKIHITGINRFFFICVSVLIFFFVLFRLSTVSQAFSGNGSGIYRLRHLNLAKNFLMTYPFGIGLQVFNYLTPILYAPEDYSYNIAEPHNIFAQIGAELGIAGLILFCFLFLRIIRHKQKAIKTDYDPFKIGVFIGCVNYLGVACFYPWFIFTPISEMFWIFMAI